MSFKKQTLKSRPVCKVTFRVPKEAAKDAKSIFIVGDFNEWDETATPMKPLKNGDFTAILELDTSKTEYQFRYLYDGRTWENDWEADAYIKNDAGTENSVIRL